MEDHHFLIRKPEPDGSFTVASSHRIDRHEFEHMFAWYGQVTSVLNLPSTIGHAYRVEVKPWVSTATTLSSGAA